MKFLLALLIVASTAILVASTGKRPHNLVAGSSSHSDGGLLDDVVRGASASYSDGWLLSEQELIYPSGSGHSDGGLLDDVVRGASAAAQQIETDQKLILDALTDQGRILDALTDQGRKIPNVHSDGGLLIKRIHEDLVPKFYTMTDQKLAKLETPEILQMCKKCARLYLAVNALGFKEILAAKGGCGRYTHNDSVPRDIEIAKFVPLLRALMEEAVARAIML